MGQAREWCEVPDVSADAPPAAAVLTLTLTLSLSLLFGACGPSHSIAPRPLDGAAGAAVNGTNEVDAAVGLAPEGGSDTGDASPFQLPSCETARTICVGADVRACVANRPGDLLEVCPYTCNLGRCTTPACMTAERNQGLAGCRFYGVQSDNIDSDDGRTLMLLLSNAAPQDVQARVEARAADGTWTLLQSATVPSLGGARIQLQRPVLGTGLSSAAAFRVETDGPVFAVQLTSDDSDRMSHSSAGSALRPLQALGRHHVAVTLPALGSAAFTATPGSRGGAGAITIIATAATRITVDLKETATSRATGTSTGAAPNADPLMAALPPQEIAMQEGDVVQIFSTLPDGDLTGTTITSEMPVAVFSGNVFTTYGYELTGFNGGDLAHEQLPPTASWGDEYVGARLSPQANCDPFFGTAVSLWRVIAAKDHTAVKIFPAPNVSVDWPNLPPSLEFTLPAGGFQSFWTRGNLTVMSPADLVVRADKPILVAQWLDCEPGLSWGIDTRLSSGTLPFTLPPRFDHELVVVKKSGASLLLDGREISQERFTPASSDRRYEVARLGPQDLVSCTDLLDRCDHRLSGPAFGVTWRGMDVVCSYALTVPSGHVCALPNAGCPL